MIPIVQMQQTQRNLASPRAADLPEAGQDHGTTAPLTNHRHTSAHSYFELDPHSRLPTNSAFLVLLPGASL